MYWCKGKKCVYQMGKMGRNYSKDKANGKGHQTNTEMGDLIYTWGVGCILLLFSPSLFSFILFMHIFILFFSKLNKKKRVY